MGSKHLHKPEPELQKTLSQPSMPVEGMKILAHIISHHLERKWQQLDFKTNNTDKNVEDQIFRDDKEGHDG